MKAPFVLLTLMMLPACSEHRKGEVVGHVPFTVGEVTYQWPTDATTDFQDLGRPEKWRGVAYIPAGVWNEVMSPVSGLQRPGWKGQIELEVGPAREKSWSIKPDGKGLPLFPSEHFEATEHGAWGTLGRGVGERIVNPSVLAVFKGEEQAYAVCIAPDPTNPKGTCHLLLNDRGVQHNIPLGWGNWKQAKAVLFLYRKLIGIPQPAAS